MHSHLIPGIDDGAKTLEESIQLIKELQGLGFEKIITTPHVMSEYFPNTPEKIKAGLAEVRAALVKEKINIPFHAAAEYFVDEQFVDWLKNDVPLLTLFDRYILIEFSTLVPPTNFQAILFQLKAKGYRPILAHPERYIYYANELDTFQQMKTLGCLFQVNLLSLTGHYGKPQKKLAQRLLKDGLVEFLGTDTHRASHLKTLERALQDRTFLQAINSQAFKNTDWI